MAKNETEEIEKLKLEAEDGKYIFVKYSDSWADEMDIEGYAVMTKAEYLEMIERVSKARFPCNHYIGTNEEIEYNNVDEFISALGVKIITLGEYKAFKSIFGSSEIGFFWTPDSDDGEDEDMEYQCLDCGFLITDFIILDRCEHCGSKNLEY